MKKILLAIFILVCIASKAQIWTTQSSNVKFLNKKYLTVKNPYDKPFTIQLINKKGEPISQKEHLDSRGFLNEAFGAYPDLYYKGMEKRENIYGCKVKFFYDRSAFYYDLEREKGLMHGEKFFMATQRIDTVLINRNGPRAYKLELMRELERLWELNDWLSDIEMVKILDYLKYILEKRDITKTEEICISEALDVLYYGKINNLPVTHIIKINAMFHRLFEEEPIPVPVSTFIYEMGFQSYLLDLHYAPFENSGFKDTARTVILDKRYPIGIGLSYIFYRTNKRIFFAGLKINQSSVFWFPKTNSNTIRREGVAISSTGISAGFYREDDPDKKIKLFVGARLGWQFNFTNRYSLLEVNKNEVQMSSREKLKYNSNNLFFDVSLGVNLYGVRISPFAHICFKSISAKSSQYKIGSYLTTGLQLAIPIASTQILVYK